MEAIDGMNIHLKLAFSSIAGGPVSFTALDPLQARKRPCYICEISLRSLYDMCYKSTVYAIKLSIKLFKMGVKK